MEDFEQKALRTAVYPPNWWYRYVDDTHTKQKKQHVQEFTDHLNSIDPDIKFTCEEEENNRLAFLDTTTVRQEDGSLKVDVFRKQTHTDQYLNFKSNHPLNQKLGVVRTLYHRANTVISDPEDQQKEVLHVNGALGRCGYPKWALSKAKEGRKHQGKEKNDPNRKSKTSVTLPYIAGLTEEAKRIFQSYNVNVCTKPTETLRQMLVSPKDKLAKDQVCGPVYKIKCDGDGKTPCQASYIGETERMLKKRIMEHKRSSSTTSEVANHIHRAHPSHTIKEADISILDQEQDWFKRGIKESIYIRLHKPTLNKDGGRHNLDPIWDSLLSSLETLGGSSH
jgi:hypothetical protein